MGGVPNALGPSPTLGSLGPSHQWRHKSRASLRSPPCAHGVAGFPKGEVRDIVELEGSISELQATNAEWAALYTHQQELISQMEASIKTSDAFIDNRTRYLFQIMWKLVQVSRDYHDLLLAHHQLQDDLRSTQRCKKKLHMQAAVRIVTL